MFAFFVELLTMFHCCGGKQRGATLAFFGKRLTMFRRGCGQFLSRGRGILRKGRRFLALLFDQ